MDAVRAHEVELTAYALGALGEVEGITIYGPRDIERRGGAVSFSLPDVHPHDIAQLLDRERRLRAGRPPLRQAAHARAGRGRHGPRERLRLQSRARRSTSWCAPWAGPGRTSRDRETMPTGLDDLYQELILDHYRKRRNEGALDAPSVAVDHNNPLCGDEIHLELLIEDGRVADVRHTGRGLLHLAGLGLDDERGGRRGCRWTTRSTWSSTSAS